MVGAGVTLGLGGAYFFTRLLRGVIPDVPSTDPVAVAGTVAVLVLAGALASLAPALRASRTHATVALREE